MGFCSAPSKVSRGQASAAPLGEGLSLPPPPSPATVTHGADKPGQALASCHCPLLPTSRNPHVSRCPCGLLILHHNYSSWRGNGPVLLAQRPYLPHLGCQTH